MGEARSDKEILLSEAESLGLDLNRSQVERLLAFAELLRKWNQRVNLISRRDMENLILGHIVDALAGVPLLKKLLGRVAAGQAASLERQAGGQPRDDAAPTHPPRVMDLGSGGGLPGIPLKIALPEMEMTLVESTKKKAGFLRSAIGDLELEGITVVDRHSRELEKDPLYRDKYDAVVVRAVAELRDLVVLSFPFLKSGGWLVAYKGARAEKEREAAEGILKRWGGVLETGSMNNLSVSGKTRHILAVRKAKRPQ